VSTQLVLIAAMLIEVSARGPSPGGVFDLIYFRGAAIVSETLRLSGEWLMVHGKLLFLGISAGYALVWTMLWFAVLTVVHIWKTRRGA
jgi:hypothetical protein